MFDIQRYLPFPVASQLMRPDLGKRPKNSQMIGGRQLVQTFFNELCLFRAIPSDQKAMIAELLFRFSVSE
jgi:hypothetical protein